MSYIDSLDRIPNVPHWAIITTSSIYIEGDERSRTHPGHGYPAHTETTIQYQAFTNEAEWRAKVIEMSTPTAWSGPKQFRAMKVIPAAIETSITVKVE